MGIERIRCEGGRKVCPPAPLFRVKGARSQVEQAY
jgi:hypothetical protein